MLSPPSAWTCEPSSLVPFCLERLLSLSALTPTCPGTPTDFVPSLSAAPTRPAFPEPVHLCCAWLQLVLLNPRPAMLYGQAHSHTHDLPEYSFTIWVTVVHFTRGKLENILPFIMKTAKEDVRSSLQHTVGKGKAEGSGEKRQYFRW